MENMDYWRLCDELTVVQAALLIVDADGGDLDYSDYVLDWDPDKRPANFSATFAALSNAVSGGRLPAAKRENETSELNWNKTTILVEDLKIWLKSRGIKTGFFSPQGDDTPDFLDSNHKNYSPKLAQLLELGRL